MSQMWWLFAVLGGVSQRWEIIIAQSHLQRQACCGCVPIHNPQTTRRNRQLQGSRASRRSHYLKYLLIFCTTVIVYLICSAFPLCSCWHPRYHPRGPSQPRPGPLFFTSYRALPFPPLCFGHVLSGSLGPASASALWAGPLRAWLVPATSGHHSE